MNSKDDPQETYPFDKVPEARMAQLIGITGRALEGKRLRGVIPEGVWNKIDSRVFYSIRRYEAWQESIWNCPPELNSLVMQSGFDSPGDTGVVKPFPTHRRQKGSRPQLISVLK